MLSVCDSLYLNTETHIRSGVVPISRSLLSTLGITQVRCELLPPPGQHMDQVRIADADVQFICYPLLEDEENSERQQNNASVKHALIQHLAAVAASDNCVLLFVVLMLFV